MGISLTPMLVVYFIAIFIVAYFCFWRPPKFYFPYFEHKFDVAVGEEWQIDALLGDYLMTVGFGEIQHHQYAIERWKTDCYEQIGNCWYGKKIREMLRKRYEDALDEANAFVFEVCVEEIGVGRTQVGVFAYSFQRLKSIYKQIEG